VIASVRDERQPRPSSDTRSADKLDQAVAEMVKPVAHAGEASHDLGRLLLGLRA
jgi:hypothetical protein